MEFSAFLGWGRCKGLGSVKSFLPCASQQSLASILSFYTSWVPRGSVWWVAAAWWLWDHRYHSPSWLPWRAGITDDCNIFVYWDARKYSTSQYKAIKEKAESYPFLSSSVCERPCLAIHRHPSGHGGCPPGKQGLRKQVWGSRDAQMARVERRGGQKRRSIRKGACGPWKGCGVPCLPTHSTTLPHHLLKFSGLLCEEWSKSISDSEAYCLAMVTQLAPSHPPSFKYAHPLLLCAEPETGGKLWTTCLLSLSSRSFYFNRGGFIEQNSVSVWANSRR